MNGKLEVIRIDMEGREIYKHEEFVSEFNIDALMDRAKDSIKEGLILRRWNNGNINLKGYLEPIFMSEPISRKLIINYYSPKFLEQKKVKLN